MKTLIEGGWVVAFNGTSHEVYEQGSVVFEADRIVHAGTDALDLLRTAVGPGAVGQQNNGEFALGIEPQRSPGKPQVTERTRREEAAGLRGRRGPIEAERARAAGFCRLRPGERAQRLGKKDCLGAGPGKTAQYRVGEAGEIGCAGKKSGVAGYAAHHAGVFVVHFAEHIEGELAGDGVQADEFGRGERGHNQEDGVGVIGARLQQLELVDDEVLAQHRDPHGRAYRVEVQRRSLMPAEIVPVMGLDPLVTAAPSVLTASPIHAPATMGSR